MTNGLLIDYKNQQMIEKLLITYLITKSKLNNWPKLVTTYKIINIRVCYGDKNIYIKENIFSHTKSLNL